MNLKDPVTKAYFMSVMVYGLSVPPLNEDNLDPEVQKFISWWLGMSQISFPMVVQDSNIMICNLDHSPICFIILKPGIIEFRNPTQDEDEVSPYFVPTIIDTVRYFINHFGPGYDIKPVKDVRNELGGSSTKFDNNIFVMP